MSHNRAPQPAHPAPESVLQTQSLVLRYQAVILGATLNGPMVKLVYEFRYAANLNVGVYGVTGLVDYIALAAIEIVLHAGRLVDTDRICITEKITPVRLDWPAPFITVSVHGVHKAEVVYHYAAITLTNGKREIGKGYRAIAAKLELTPNPMFSGWAVALPGFVINADEGI